MSWVYASDDPLNSESGKKKKNAPRASSSSSSIPFPNNTTHTHLTRHSHAETNESSGCQSINDVSCCCDDSIQYFSWTESKPKPNQPILMQSMQCNTIQIQIQADADAINTSRTTNQIPNLNKVTTEDEKVNVIASASANSSSNVESSASPSVPIPSPSFGLPLPLSPSQLSQTVSITLSQSQSQSQSQLHTLSQQPQLVSTPLHVSSALPLPLPSPFPLSPTPPRHSRTNRAESELLTPDTIVASAVVINPLSPFPSISPSSSSSSTAMSATNSSISAQLPPQSNLNSSTITPIASTLQLKSRFAQRLIAAASPVKQHHPSAQTEATQLIASIPSSEATATATATAAPNPPIRLENTETTPINPSTMSTVSSDPIPSDFVLGFTRGGDSSRRLNPSADSMRKAIKMMEQVEMESQAHQQEGKRTDEQQVTNSSFRPSFVNQKAISSVASVNIADRAKPATASSSSSSFKHPQRIIHQKQLSTLKSLQHEDSSRMLDEGYEMNRSNALIPADFQLGFTSGAGKQVRISESALKKAEQQFRQLQDEQEQEESLMAKGNANEDHTMQVNTVRTAYAADEIADTPMLDATSETGAVADIPVGFELGFSSGSGKRVIISDSAMKKAEYLFQQAEKEQEQKQAQGHEQDAKPTLRSTVSVMQSVGETSVPSSVPVSSVPFEFGFSSGRGNRIPISHARLKAAEQFIAKVMQEETDTDMMAQEEKIDPEQSVRSVPSDSTIATTTNTGVVGSASTTASGALVAAQALMNEFESQFIAPPTNSNATITTPVGVADRLSKMRRADSTDSLSTSAHALKKRKSSHAAAIALPMPLIYNGDDEVHDAESNPQQQHNASMPVSTVLHTPRTESSMRNVATPTLRSRTSSASGSLSANANANRKRFVSPRVAAAKQTPTAPAAAQPNLLHVKARQPQTQAGNNLHNTSHGGSGHPSASVVAIPTPNVMSSNTDTRRIQLRDFAALCRSKLSQQQLAGTDSIPSHTIRHTNIPADCITSLNASLVQFIRPEQIPLAIDGQHVEPSLGWLDVRASLLAQGLSPSACSIAWVRNQYRWVVWKLASYDRAFSTALTAPALTYQRMVIQIYQRFDREVNQVARSAIKKILEGDEVAGRFIILTVAQVIGSKPTPSPTSLTNVNPLSLLVDDESGAIPTRPSGCEVELSDGWYSCWAKLDAHLFQQMQMRKIYPGQKLRIWGASLQGPTPTTPLENSETYFKLQINSVRRALWYSRMGVQQASSFLVNMRSLRADGGLIPAIKVAVSKQYPTLFLHPAGNDSHAVVGTNNDGAIAAGTASDGKSSSSSSAVLPTKPRKLHCNERSHDLRMRLHEQLFEKKMESINNPYAERVLKPDEQEEWEIKQSELRAELQDIRDQVTPYMVLHLCELNEHRSAANLTTEGDFNHMDSKHKLPNAASSITGQSAEWTGECASFTVWRSTDEHREMLQAGREFIIYGATVHSRYKQMTEVKNQTETDSPGHKHVPTLAHSLYTTSPSLSLATSRKTSIVPLALSKAKSSAESNSVQANKLPIRSEFVRHTLVMRSSELLNLPRSAEFDCIALVVWTGVEEGDQVSSISSSSSKWHRTRRLLCVGMSGEKLMIQVNESEELMHFNAPFATPQLVLMENVQYSLFDKRLKLHTATANKFTKFTLKGSITFPSTESLPAIHSSHSPLPHTVYAEASVPHFQAWASHNPMVPHLASVLLKQCQQIMSGSWDFQSSNISTFNQHDFQQLHQFHLNGTLHPLTSNSIIICHKDSEDLGEMLRPTTSAIDHLRTNEATNSVLNTSKKPSLLSTGHHVNKPFEWSQEGAIARNCAECSNPIHVGYSSPLCFHTAHTLSYLLDSIHWSCLLVLDDAVRRWPLQFDSYSFRCLINSTTRGSNSEAETSELVEYASNWSRSPCIRSWWQHLMRTGEVPMCHSMADAQQQSLYTALKQLRKLTFRILGKKFEMDEQHQNAQIADWIMLVFAHSHHRSVNAFVQDSSICDMLSTLCNGNGSVQDDSNEDQLLAFHSLISSSAAVSETDFQSPDLMLANALIGSSQSHSLSPLFFFTSDEWSALSEAFFASLAFKRIECDAAECERANALSTAIQNSVRVTAVPFKSAFIPNLETFTCV